MYRAFGRRVLGSLRYRSQSFTRGASILLRNRLGVLEQSSGVAILDDWFPYLLTSFRVSEFNCYLEALPGSRVYSCDPAYAAHFQAYERAHPHLASRVRPWSPPRYLPGTAAYCVFINNASRFVPIMEKHGLPFAFTLYPGGGFHIDEEDNDRKLRRVFGSPCFRKVIVTQRITRDYLLSKEFCDPSEVEFVYGGVLPSDIHDAQSVPKKYCGGDKDTFDICFAANKYMPKGIDKGYDVFIEVARILSAEIEQARFHVIGGFGPDDIDVSDLGNRIRFHGVKYREDFVRVYDGLDLILSPNVPFRQYPGAFDGFPTGCCIEAALSGVAVFATDCLGSNIALKDGEEIVIIPREARQIADIVCSYYSDLDTLYQLSANGQRAFAKVFGLEAQMAPRLAILGDLLAEGAVAVRAHRRKSPLPVPTAWRDDPGN
jgi:glycosyltransferase involved in cell wall biosynthesis